MDELAAGARALGELIDARSVVVVGASPDPRKLAGRTLPNLRNYGYAGAVSAVNPSRDEVDGYPCFASVRDLPDRPDTAFIVAPAAAVTTVLRDLEEIEVPSATIVASGFGDDDSPQGRARSAELTAVLAGSRLRVLGPNSIGTLDAHSGAVFRASTNLPDQLIAGNVSVATQSGAISLILLHLLHVEGLGVRQVIPLGNEADLGLAEAIVHAAHDDATRCLVTFLESVRQPDALAAAMAVAHEHDLHVVAIVAGASQTGSAIASGHTGALATDSRLTRALLRDLGMSIANGPRDALEVARLVSVRQRASAVRDGLALVCLSGGEAALLADRAEDAGIDLPQPVGAHFDALSREFRFTTPRNPLDVTADALTHPQLFASAYDVLSSDPRIGEIAFVLPPLANLDRKRIYEVLDGLGEGPRPVTVVGWPVAGVPRRPSEFADSSAYLGAWAKLAAANGFGRARELRSSRRPGSAEPASWLDDDTVRVRAREVGLVLVDEVFLADDAAVEAVTPTGPWVLKASVAGVAHKTDWGGVLPGLRTRDELRAGLGMLRERAHERWPGRFRGAWLQQQIGGIELYLGAFRHPLLGPFLAVGRGGVDVERDAQVVFVPLPAGDDTLTATLTALDVPGTMLTRRGHEPVDVQTLVPVCAAVGRLLDAPDVVSADANPVFLTPSGAVAVDVRIGVTDGTTA